jgi:hypothetical protein
MHRPAPPCPIAASPGRTSRFAYLALSDPCGYASSRELARRLEYLAARKVELVAALCEGDDQTAPLAEHNLAGKPVLKYDRVVRPHELHALKPAPETRSAPSGSESETSPAAPRRRLPRRRFCQPLSSVGAGVISGGRRAPDA